MPSLSLDNNQARYQIRAFKLGQVQVNETIYRHNLILSAQQLIANWAPQTAADLTQEHLAQAASLKPDILIIGTGAKQQFIPLDLYGDLLNQGIGVELMDSAAACRTYNVLTAENRNVVVALILG